MTAGDIMMWTGIIIGVVVWLILWLDIREARRAQRNYQAAMQRGDTAERDRLMGLRHNDDKRTEGRPCQPTSQ